MKSSKNYLLLLTSISLFGFANAQGIKKKKSEKKLPNIIYILTDDLGYGDESIYNLKGKIKTPNIDKLAKQGMRFTDAHTTSGVCTPSRYSILTGIYPWRSRLPVGVLHGYSRTLIEKGQPTVAALLKSHAYTTGVVGKWHLGLDWVPNAKSKDSVQNQINTNKLYGISSDMNPDQIDFSVAPINGPRTQGFDYSYILPASLDMPPYCYLENDTLTEMPTGFTPGSKLESGYTGPFWRAGLMSPSFDFKNVLPHFTNKAIGFIKTQSAAANPFFLYFPMPAPHTPWLPTAGFIGRSNAGEYGDFVQMVDDAVGKLLRSIDSLGLSENTMVVFTSDNGPYWRDNFVKQYNHHAAGEFRGMKGDAFEGGHRVPLIVRYPKKVKAGSVSNVTTSLANFMATCSEIVGEKSDKFKMGDSYSILPNLESKVSKTVEQHPIVIISSKGLFAIRKGPWKLITGLGSGGFTDPSEVKSKPGEAVGQLYNLEKDIHEDNNLYQQYPEKVKELSALLATIKKQK